MKNEILLGGVGVTLGAVGTATQINEVLQTISLVITIVGAIISCIVVPIVNWYAKAKKDGKITAEEVKEAATTLQDGANKVKEKIDEERNK